MVFCLFLVWTSFNFLLGEKNCIQKKICLWCVEYCEWLSLKTFLIVSLRFPFENCSEVWLWQIPRYKFRWTCCRTFRCYRIKRAMGTCLSRCKLLQTTFLRFPTCNCILTCSRYWQAIRCLLLVALSQSLPYCNF